MERKKIVIAIILVGIISIVTFLITYKINTEKNVIRNQEEKNNNEGVIHNTPTTTTAKLATSTEQKKSESSPQKLFSELHNFLAAKKYPSDFIVVNEYVESNEFAVFSGHIGARHELVVMKHGNTWEILKDIDSIYSIADWEGRKSPCTITVVEGDIHFSCVSEYTDTAEGRVATIKTYVYSGDGVFLDVLEEEEQSVL